MAEWLKATVLKTVVPQGIVSSNLTASALTGSENEVYLTSSASKRIMNSSQYQSLKKNLLVASIGIFSGLFILGIASGIVPTDPGSVHAPMWLVTLCGILFLIGGIAALGIGVFSRRVQDVLGAFVMMILFAICFEFAMK